MSRLCRERAYGICNCLTVTGNECTAYTGADKSLIKTNVDEFLEKLSPNTFPSNLCDFQFRFQLVISLVELSFPN